MSFWARFAWHKDIHSVPPPDLSVVIKPVAKAIEMAMTDAFGSGVRLREVSRKCEWDRQALRRIK
jgi:hypothetical protein